MRPTTPRLIQALTLLVSLGVLCFGCGNDDSENAPPRIDLVTGPMDGDTTSYAIHLSWHGEDEDGSIIRYEVAIDPPAAFSESEIDRGGPEVHITVLHGHSGEPDTTRCSKSGPEGVIYFDWVHTTSTDGDYAFSTTQADSIVVAGVRVATGRFTGMHAVYVRAVDNDNAISVPARVAFTASTVAPSSEITIPSIHAEAAGYVQPALPLAWTGNDPDSRGSGHLPSEYLVLLVPLDQTGCCPDDYRLGQLETLGAWTKMSSETTSGTFNLEYPQEYLFAVRAVDDNGVVEPFLDWGRNVIRLIPSNGIPSKISFICTGKRFTLRGINRDYAAEIPVGTDLNCTLFCTSTQAQISCGEFRWGVDVPDVDDPAGWTPWSTNSFIPSVRFDSPGNHVLAMEARDQVGMISRAAITFSVVAFTFDRDILFVDDSFDEIYPRDSEHDAFWNDLLEQGGSRSYDVFSAHGPNDRGSEIPAVPTLAELARHRLIIWECRGSGYNAETSLLHAAGLTPLLALYLEEGGQLWLGGRMTVGATLPDDEGLGTLSYPVALDPGDFAWDLLKIRVHRVNNDKGIHADDNLLEAIPCAGVASEYDTLVVDGTKLSSFQQTTGGIIQVDALSGPLLTDAISGFRGSLDSLYTYGAAGPLLRGEGSSYQGRLIGLRWHDPDPERQQGRIQWFGFPLYFFPSEPARTVFEHSLSWFAEESTAP